MNIQNKIHILDPHEAIKIAAGEVIERPANIIKELIENSVDAGATRISVHLTAAGKEMIKITDNGYGMSPLDAKLCFAHHATSKITSVNELASIVTYGFRGEALSSVASVSTVELFTKTEDQKVGTHIKIEYSKLLSEDIAPHQIGTTLIITNLFANIPARKKFLKSDDTEYNQIVSIFQAFCLRYLNISFQLFSNETLSLNCPATDSIAMRCAQLWSGNLHDQLISLPSVTEREITLHGAISSPHYYRFNRGQIFTFVNNRWVKNHELVKGILQGYDGVLPHQKFPATFLFIDIAPHLIDVNVHPKKEEVKFLSPGVVQKIVASAVSKALSESINQKITPAPVYVPAMQEVRPIQKSFFIDSDPFEKKEDDKLSPATHGEAKSKAWEARKDGSRIASGMVECIPAPWAASKQSLQQPQTAMPQPAIKKDSSESIFEEAPYCVVGQFKKTYIIIEQENELVMIDQHAAHERIIYQRLLQTTESSSVQLMFPHIVKLPGISTIRLQAHQHLLQQHGIVAEAFSETEMIITATPIGMQAAGAEDVVRMIAEMEHDSASREINQIHEKILQMKACKAAVKAGDALDMQQMQALLKDLMASPSRFSCPHGRPTMWNMSLKEIEKHFKRDYVGSKNMNLTF